MNLLKEIWKFSINPISVRHLDNEFDYNLSTVRIFKTLLIFFGLLILSLIPAKILLLLISHFYSFDLFKTQKNNFLSVADGLKLLIILTLLTPILEEIMFRLWLSFKKPHIILSLTVIFSLLLNTFNNNDVSTQKINVLFFENLFIAVLLGIIIGYIIFLKPLELFFTRNFKFFYWISCIGFGLIHISNYQPLQMNIFWIYPFLVLPQIISGFFFGYFRVKKGFFVALLFHCLVNLPQALIYFSHQK
jgi:membrane protease YdiL (CAAX protease family)